MSNVETLYHHHHDCFKSGQVLVSLVVDFFCFLFFCLFVCVFCFVFVDFAVNNFHTE